MTRLLGALVLSLLLVGCGDSSKSPESFTASGVLTLGATGSDALVDGKAGSPCQGKKGYGDLAEGTQVVVRDASGKTLGLGVLRAGSLTEDMPDAYSSSPCEFRFTVPSIVAGDDAAIYSVEIAHRGQIQFTRDEAGLLALTLG